MNLDTNTSLIFGILSNFCFLFVFFPQFYINHTNKNSNGISFILLYCFIFGDILSLIAAYTKELSIVIIYTSIFHIILDLIIIIQVLYYKFYYQSITEEILPLIQYENTNVNVNKFSLFETSIIIFSLIFIFINCLGIYYFNEQHHFDISIFIANILGWITTFIFIISRIPQIYLNYTKKSTEGLSLYTFILLTITNLLFLSSILVLIPNEKSNQIEFIIYNIQWILGCTVTILFDFVIFYQFIIYKTVN